MSISETAANFMIVDAGAGVGSGAGPAGKRAEPGPPGGRAGLRGG